MSSQIHTLRIQGEEVCMTEGRNSYPWLAFLAPSNPRAMGEAEIRSVVTSAAHLVP